jgi:hypothetical protein
MARHHIAQVNASLPREPLDSQRLADFVAALDPVNAVGEAAHGFVWRLQTEDGNATAVRFLDDDRLIVNLTVWESIEALGEFAFGDHAHLEVLRRRRHWFVPPTAAMVALWWIPAGTLPTVADAEQRLLNLREHGPTPYAFTFRDPFAAPDADAAAPSADEGWFCPV